MKERKSHKFMLVIMETHQEKGGRQNYLKSSTFFVTVKLAKLIILILIDYWKYLKLLWKLLQMD